ARRISLDPELRVAATVSAAVGGWHLRNRYRTSSFWKGQPNGAGLTESAKHRMYRGAVGTTVGRLGCECRTHRNDQDEAQQCKPREPPPDIAGMSQGKRTRESVR